ncbi:MAG: hypothetical protein N3I86_07330 [Verrucomicrobiae bacterium]|nr:hypothetical protein [Verrucomicrobiae bacterium]MDW8308352.1 urease accessory UreF family protein [Verrucomicrobiales bacterium]
MRLWPQPELTFDPAEWLGDAHPLVAQLALAESLVSLHSLARLLTPRPISNLFSLRLFLERYYDTLLLPHELPAIRDAYHLAARRHHRDLIALDQRLAGETALREFAAPSRRVGQSQLRRLRPLRDERTVQRYLEAVETGEADGWHTLVYGLTLVVYSLPLRQGLLGYAHQITRGFIHAAARSMEVTEAECRELFEAVCEPLPDAVERLLADEPPLRVS